MAVLVEAISVIVRRRSVETHFAGGLAGFRRAVPNRSYCADGTLLRAGFMAPKDVAAFVSILEAGGLTFLRDDQAVDLTVVDQLRGSTVPAPWLEVGKYAIGPTANVTAAWAANEARGPLATPDGWIFEESLSASHHFVSHEEFNERLLFLRREDRADVYLDRATGKEVFIGRAAARGDTPEARFVRLEGIAGTAFEVGRTMDALESPADDEQLEALRRHVEDELLPALQDVLDMPQANDDVFTQFTRGLVLRLLNRRDEAERAFRRANELQPGVPNTLIELVRCLGEQGKYEEALPFAEQAVALNPEGPAAWGNLATCAFRCGDVTRAREAVDRALVLDPENAINRHIEALIAGHVTA